MIRRTKRGWEQYAKSLSARMSPVQIGEWFPERLVSSPAGSSPLGGFGVVALARLGGVPGRSPRRQVETGILRPFDQGVSSRVAIEQWRAPVQQRREAPAGG